MKGAVKFSDYLRKQLKDKAFQRAFDGEEVYAALAIQIAKLRQDNGYSQQKLAHILRTSQQTVSRLEDTENKSLSMNTLINLARAFHRKLRIQFVRSLS
jgi:DNA-binding XRE family transcriptional regulator